MFFKVTRYARAVRFWLLLALAALAWLGVGEAIAQDAGQAKLACEANLRAALAIDPVNRTRDHRSCAKHPTANAFECIFVHPPSDGGYGACGIWLHGYVTSCASRPNEVVPIIGRRMVRTGELSCEDGCEAMTYSNGDGTRTIDYGNDKACNPTDQCPTALEALGWTWNYTTGSCQPPTENCPANQVKDPTTGECSAACQAGMKLNALGECEPDGEKCPVGMTKAPDGSCAGDQEPNKCPAGQTKGPDGTCKPDEDGDGDPDGEGEGEGSSFSGGDNCDVPPSCSGDPIMCGQARIQWRIDCNTRKDTKVSGGTCASVPICAGKNCDALEYSQLLQQWRTACALEQLKIPGGGSGSADGIAEYFDGKYSSETDKLNAIAAEGDGLTGVTEDTIWAGESTDGTPNPNLFGSPVSYCSFSASMDFFGHSIDPGPAFWELMSWIGWLVVASAYLWVAQKIGD